MQQYGSVYISSSRGHVTLDPFLGERTPRMSCPRVPVSWRGPVRDLGSNITTELRLFDKKDCLCSSRRDTHVGSELPRANEIDILLAVHGQGCRKLRKVVQSFERHRGGKIASSIKYRGLPCSSSIGSKIRKILPEYSMLLHCIYHGIRLRTT